MRYYTGESISTFFSELEAVPEKERVLMLNLLAALYGKATDKVVILYGLRRTGKSTLMRQAIMHYVGTANTLYILCEKNDTIQQLTQIINDNKQKFVFIDEITKLTDFMDNSSSLADVFAVEGRKLVLTGTDSLGFKIAKGSELLDRVYLIHTTYISYAEFNYLLGKDIFDYMKYGGTLSEESPFISKESADEYTNSAIIDNLLHTYELWDDGEREQELLCGFSKKEIRSIITYYIRRENIRFLASELTKFKASEFHVAAKIIRKDTECDIDPDIILRNEQLTDAWQEQLGIIDKYKTPITNEVLEVIAGNLIDLNVLSLLKVRGENRYYFSQPGLRYCHIDEALAMLRDNPNLLRQYTSGEIDYVMGLFRNNIEGHLLETIILVDLYKKYYKNSDIELRQFRVNVSEYDIVIENINLHTAMAFEVKRSSEIIEQQKRWLVDQDFQDIYEGQTGNKIIGKAVLYSGVTTADKDGMPYINIGDFLCNADTYTNKVTDITNNSRLIMQIYTALASMKVKDMDAWMHDHTTSEKLGLIGFDYYAR